MVSLSDFAGMSIVRIPLFTIFPPFFFEFLDSAGEPKALIGRDAAPGPGVRTCPVLSGSKGVRTFRSGTFRIVKGIYNRENALMTWSITVRQGRTEIGMQGISTHGGRKNDGRDRKNDGRQSSSLESKRGKQNHGEKR